MGRNNDIVKVFSAINRSFETLWSALFFMAVISMATAHCRAQAGAPYQASQPITGTIRIWGDDNMSGVTSAWEKGFQKFHPHVSFETRLMGTSTAMPGIYTGVADLALIGRETNTTDNDGFLHVLQYRPLRFELMTGSLDEPGKSYALAIFVHKDNPLSKLTLTQLDAVFGCEHRRGLDNIRTWGQLGLAGEWKNKSITLYSYDAETGTGRFFLHAVLADSRKMNWEALKEFKDIETLSGSTYESGQQIIDALRKDRFGLAVSSVRYANPQVKEISLAVRDGGPYFIATRDNLISRKYPLTRVTYAFVNQQPDKHIDPKVREFLRYIFSLEGQEDIARDHGYLPLSQETIREQLKKLN
jgi:phosphate transport system substrate-binding protein